MSNNSTIGSSTTSGTTPVDYLGSLGSLTGLPFDPNTLVNGLLQADQIPITNLQTQIKNIQTNESIYKSIGTDVNALGSLAFNLTLQSNVQANAATSSNATGATATAGPSAVAGSYTVLVNSLATPTVATSQTPLGAAIDPSKTLSALNLNGMLTAGNFSLVVDGKFLQPIAVDPSQTLQSVLSHMQSTIAGAVGVDSSAVSVTMSNNKLQVSLATGAAASHAIIFGAGGDTSNFLSLMNLSTVQGTVAPGGALTSSTGVGVVQPAQLLNAAALATPLTSTTNDGAGNLTGSFAVNGVSIAWNAGTDSVNDVIGRINSSSAGVTAQYNSATDALVLTNKTTGQAAMNLQDTTGNFLQAMNLQPDTTGAQALGTSASLTLNGKTTVTSPTNTFSNVVPGLSITALTQGQTAALTVGPDTTGVTKQVQAFVDGVNKVLGDINLTQQKDPTSGTYSSLLGDPVLNSLKDRLITTITGALTSSGSYQSLQDIGVTTGIVGSAAGTTSTLHLDTTKLAAALTANPSAVANLFTGTKAVNGFDGVAQQLNTYLLQQSNPFTGPFGQYQSSGDARVKTIQTQITALQAAMANHRKILTTQFTAMSNALSMLNNQAAIFASSGASSSSSSSSSGSGP
jgi:flagellar hook-associated protein 2